MISGTELHELLQQTVVARVVKVCVMTEDLEDPPIPPEISELLEQYAVLFEEPKGLPPQWSFDHSIPLVPGTRPVNIWPYRHSPAQKDEVE